MCTKEFINVAENGQGAQGVNNPMLSIQIVLNRGIFECIKQSKILDVMSLFNSFLFETSLL